MTRRLITFCAAQMTANENSARLMRLDNFVVSDFPEFLRQIQTSA